MAERIPLKMKSGHVHQMESGDTINANLIGGGGVSNTEFDYLDGVTSAIQDQLDSKLTAVTQKTNNSGGTIEAGAPVYLDSSGEIVKARANSTTTAEVFGLAVEDISDSNSGGVATEGALTLATAVWDAITGGSSGLTPGTEYFLSAATAGRLVTTAPTTTGQQVTRVGIAESDDTMRIRVEPYIGL